MLIEEAYAVFNSLIYFSTVASCWKVLQTNNRKGSEEVNFASVFIIMMGVYHRLEIGVESLLLLIT